MTTKKTLSFTDRHHRFLTEKVKQGVFASQSAAVAAAPKQMVRDGEERDIALNALADEVRSRMETPRSDYVEADDAFAATHARLVTSNKA